MTGLPDPRQSRAVLIGVGSYRKLSDLPAVHNNLVAFDEVLRADRFWGLPQENCMLVYDPETAAEMLDPVVEAAQAATDTLLLYYAGHGLVGRRSELHLALAGSDPQRMYTSVLYDNLRDELLNSRAARRLVILDCCYSGRALGQMSGSVSAVVEEASAEGTYILAATAENKTALAPPGRDYTAFTGEFLDILRKGIGTCGPLLDLDSIYQHLLSGMREKGFPIPQKRDRNTAGQITLVRNQAFKAPSSVTDAATAQRSAESVPPLPDALRAGLDSPIPAIRIGAVNELAEWLTSGDHVRVLAARCHLRVVAERDIPRVADAARAGLLADVTEAPAIFLSYRRDQSEWTALRLRDRMAEVLGSEQILMSAGSIEPGQDVVDAAIGRCRVLLAVIGPDWADARDTAGRLQLETPNDPVRVEIESALRRPDVLVIPVLIDGAAMPRVEQLPGELAQLSLRQPAQISVSGSTRQLETLIGRLQSILAQPAVGQSPRSEAQARSAGYGVTGGPLALEETCPSCGAQVGAADSFCDSCGTELAPLAVSTAPLGFTAECPVCSVDPEAPPSVITPEGYCESCGHKVPSSRDHSELDLGLLAGVTDRGLQHTRNEGAMALATANGPRGPVAIAVVCDAVSTSPRPDDASLVAAQASVRTLLTSARRSDDSADASLAAVYSAHQALARLGSPEEAPSATYISAVIDSEAVTVCWLGNSRAYWLSTSPDATRLSTDDSLAEEMVAQGTLSKADAMASPQAHVITRWLGADLAEPKPHFVRFEPPGPGAVLVCSDGLWNYQPEAADLAELALPAALTDPLSAAAALVRFALEAGGMDNITVVLAPFPPCEPAT